MPIDPPHLPLTPVGIAFRCRRSHDPAPVCGGEGRKIASSSRVTPCRQSAKRRALSENTSGRPRLLIIYDGSRKGQTYSVCLSVCLIMGENLMLSTPFCRCFKGFPVLRFRSDASKKRSCAALSAWLSPDAPPPRHTPKPGQFSAPANGYS